ncbi:MULTISPECIES: YqaA family protein [unclassified Acidocella]|uniref:YqaA family protein n=1 Tax=unclassified Acidocella TaxID=2648610 RepID=UPI00028E707D|nr:MULTISPECIES: YqaA family protein [unclassified Acidocella]EKM99690.1 putative membrane-associated alkaline phosphatase [Acidocella sp. MX-AZ02]WBO58343.1 DedA family protein [Acidocella sp. MX-AZ03]
MLRRLYDWALDLSARPLAPLWLFLVAMAEASVFPLPPDVLLIPMALAKPRRALLFAAIATLGSVLGGAIGYALGYALFVKLAQPIIHFYHYDAAFAAFQQKFATYGAAIILVKGLTPIPYKIVTIAAGAAKFNFWLFMGLSLITRGVRFFLEAILLRLFGDPARVFIEKRLGLLTALFAIILVGGFLILKFA